MSATMWPTHKARSLHRRRGSYGDRHVGNRYTVDRPEFHRLTHELHDEWQQIIQARRIADFRDTYVNQPKKKS